ncbi:hypothetical protein [Sphingomonas sp.]|uniref:hypothetical protein n=1 Tax=Sphingomonas sp. TaxID=28214 RepID=UPI00286E4F11|nr:hypothetical protein [Sphingomonas sp.]
MHGIRPAFALDPRQFGRRLVAHDAPTAPEAMLSEDFKLFAATFSAGFLFVSILVA